MKFLILISALVSSGAFAGTVSFGFKNKNALLIDATASSCTQMIGGQMSNRLPMHDISSNYFSLLAPSLSFTGATGEKAWIFRISVTLKDGGLAGGSYRCDIAGEELGWIFAANATTPWNGELNEASPSAKVNPLCGSLKCGGVELTPGASFRTPAIVSADGYIVDADGNETPFTASTTMNIESRP